MRRLSRSDLKRLFEATLPPEEEVARWVESLPQIAGFPLAGTIVEVGTSFGHRLARLARAADLRIVGLVADDAIRGEATRRNGYSGLIFMGGDGGRIPLQQGEATLVLVNAPPTTVDPAGLAAEIARVLRPEGAVVVESAPSDPDAIVATMRSGSAPPASDYADRLVGELAAVGFGAEERRVEGRRVALSAADHRERLRLISSLAAGDQVEGGSALPSAPAPAGEDGRIEVVRRRLSR